MNSSYQYIPLAKVDSLNSKDSDNAISSPILFELLNGLSIEEHHQILDVMPVRQGIIDVFSGFACKLYLPGCLQELCSISSEKYDTANKLNRVFTKTFGLYKKQRAFLNIIFLWDLPNYLDKQVMQSLIEYLSQHMHENIKLHMYIHTRQQMPSSPGSYLILPDGKVGLELSRDGSIKSPLYFQEKLQKLLHPFKVKRSMLISGGLQEYILEL